MAQVKQADPHPPRPDRENGAVAGLTATEQQLAALVDSEFHVCLCAVRQYVPVDRQPAVHIVVGGEHIELPNGGILPAWIKALSIRDNIYLLADRGPWDDALVRVVLAHELFHSAVWIYLAGREKVPVWFNEAVAHWIAKREFASDLSKARGRLAVSGKKADGGMRGETGPGDTYADAQTEVFISYLLRSEYDASTIRRLLALVVGGRKFPGAVHEVLGLDMSGSG